MCVPPYSPYHRYPIGVCSPKTRRTFGKRYVWHSIHSFMLCSVRRSREQPSAAVSGPSSKPAQMAYIIRNCAKASHALSRDEARDFHRVCQAAMEVSRHGVSRFVMAFDGRPCLQSCSADGAPIHVSVEPQRHLPSGRLVVRVGKASHELLAATHFSRCGNPSGEPVARLCVRDPLHLTRRSGLLDIFAACGAPCASWTTVAA